MGFPRHAVASGKQAKKWCFMGTFRLILRDVCLRVEACLRLKPGATDSGIDRGRDFAVHSRTREEGNRTAITGKNCQAMGKSKTGYSRSGVGSVVREDFSLGIIASQ